MARRVSLHDVRLPPNLLKDIDVEQMGKLSEDEGAFMEFLDSLDLEDVRHASLDWDYTGLSAWYLCQLSFKTEIATPHKTFL